VAPEPAQRRAAAGQRVRTARQLALVAAGEAGSPARIGPGPTQVLDEAAPCQPCGVDLAAPVALPELVVDAAIRRQPTAGVGKALGLERDLEGGALGPSEVEEGVVEIEQDGPECQGYFAR
jgi:hypothetical protein